MSERRLVRRERIPRPRRAWPSGAGALLGAGSSSRAGRALTAAVVVLVGALSPLVDLPHAAPVRAATVRVVDDDAGCGGLAPCYGTVQAAVDAAQSGDTVRVRPGRYMEAVLVVDKALSFEGPGVGPSPETPDPARHAIWGTSSGALTVDAFSGDITATAVSGFVFAGVPGARGIALLGRRAGEPGPAGRPVGAVDTRITAAEVRDSSFEHEPPAAARLAGANDAPDARDPAALVAARVGRLQVDDVRMAGASDAAGLVLVDVDQATVRRSTIRDYAAGVRIFESLPPVGRATLVLGGAAADGNRLGGNHGPAIELINTAGSGTTSDVLAGDNDWGVSTAPEIEGSIVDGRDAAGLGRVRWQPPHGVPAAVTLAPTPPQIEADGQARAALVAAVADAVGRPVADGALVSFALVGPGTLQGGGGTAEAEGGAVRRTGEWGVFSATTYGPNSGGSYVRSERPGDALAWAFDAPAALLRLGHGSGADAAVSVAIDDRPAVVLSARGEADTWVDHVIARDLGPGPHVLTATVLTGRIALDALAAGPTTRGGTATAHVVAPAAVGEATVTAVAWGAAGAKSASATIRYVAGLPSAMRLSFGAPRLAVGGRTTSVTAAVEDGLGRPAPDGTVVTFAASGVTLAALTEMTRDGRATVGLTSGDAVGTAVVTATAGAGLVATGTLDIVAGPPAAVEIVPSRPSMTANSRDEALIVVRVRDAFGNPVQDGTGVTGATDLGTLTMHRAVSAGGIVTGVLRAGAAAGTATVRATASDAGGRAEGTAAVAFVAPDVSISKIVEPESVVVPGERITYTVRYRNNGPGTVYGLRIEEPFPQGLLGARIETFGPPLEADPAAEYAFSAPRLTAGQGGSIVISARVDTSLRWGSRFTMTNQVRAFAPGTAERTPADNVAAATIVIAPESVYTLTLTAPETLAVGGASGELVIRAFDKFGRPAQDGTPVSLSAEFGMGTVTPELVTTEHGVARATFVSDRRAGLARVRALTLEGRGAIARIQIMPGPPTLLDLVAGAAAAEVGGATVPVTVTLRDQYGNRAGGEEVRFESDLGVMTPARRFAAPSGVATSTLTTGTRTGLATIVARGAARQARVTLDIRPGPPVTLDLLLAAASAPPGARVHGWATVRDRFANPVPGVVVRFTTDIGRLNRAEGATDDGGRADIEIATTVGDRGSGHVRASVRNGVSLDASAALAVDAARVYLPIGFRTRR